MRQDSILFSTTHPTGGNLYVVITRARQVLPGCRCVSRSADNAERVEQPPLQGAEPEPTLCQIRRLSVCLFGFCFMVGASTLPQKVLEHKIALRRCAGKRKKLSVSASISGPSTTRYVFVVPGRSTVACQAGLRLSQCERKHKLLFQVLIGV